MKHDQAWSPSLALSTYKDQAADFIDDELFTALLVAPYPHFRKESMRGDSCLPHPSAGRVEW